MVEVGDIVIGVDYRDLEHLDNRPSFVSSMLKYVGRKGTIVSISGERCRVKFSDGECWWYLIEDVRIKNLSEENVKLLDCYKGLEFNKNDFEKIGDVYIHVKDRKIVYVN